MTGWHVTSNDIKSWTETNKRRAEETLPLLVKKLILASCEPKEINFSSGDAIAIGGWDGTIDVAEATQFIPAGKSGWEIGTNKNVKGKADDDYSKRSKKPDPFKLDETTFVFVTSRLWTKRDGWVRSKSSNNEWKDVKGINAETLENWLETCPAVHRWFATFLDKRLDSTKDVEQAWNEYKNQTKVNITSDFLLHNREKESKAIDEIVTKQPGSHLIKSESKIEAYGFILASFLDSDIAKCRCLIIKDQESWDCITSRKQSLILVPLGFTPSGKGTAVSNGHTVISAIDEKDIKADKADICLSHQSRLDRQEGLKKLGFNDEEIQSLYDDTKGYLEPLLRHPLLKPVDFELPDWPNKFKSEVLFAVLFASEWCDENKYDKEALEILSGLRYSEFNQIIIKLSKENDTPIRLVGKVWQVISKVDYWLLIESKIAVPYFKCLGKTISIVLADLDPSYDLPSNERYMAPIKGAVPKYSDLLKIGLSDSLALLTAHSDELSPQLGGYKPSDDIRIWVRDHFGTNKELKFWYSLGSCMQLVAEAAPEEFISAVEAATSNKNPYLLGLFEEKGSAILGGDCDHLNLLCSLEQLSWKKQYFAKVSLCLARLVEIDPGGRWANRPSSSLVHIYLGWINNTSISHEQRVQVLDKVLISQYPEVTWKLMLSLLIKNSGVTTGISKPKYQYWSKDIERSATTHDYNNYVDSIENLLFSKIDYGKCSRLCDLIDNLNSYTETHQQELISKLLGQTVDLISDKDRDRILNQLRITLSCHRERPDSEYPYSTELLDQLEEVYHHFNYADTVKANVFLFNDDYPRFIHPVSQEERDDLVQDSRIKIIETLYQEGGNNALEKLILASPCPDIVGYSTYKSSVSTDVLSKALKWLSEDDKYVIFSKKYFSVLAHENMNSAVDILKGNPSWGEDKKSQFLLCFPVNKETLALVDELDQAGKSLYWTQLHRYFLADKDIDLVAIIAARFLENEMPLAALDTISHMFHNSGASLLDGNLVESILIKIAIDPKGLNSHSIQSGQYKILNAIGLIQNCSGIKVENIRQIEWLYLPIFRFRKVQPCYLFKYVAENPVFFAQLVIWIYKRNDNVEELSQEKQKQRTETAMKLLDTLSILPGVVGEDINKDILNSWVDEARAIFEESGLIDIGDSKIGTYLAGSQVGNDGIWPHESVRDVLERIKNKQIEDGIICGKINARGVTCRGQYAGGLQEKELACRYKEDAEKIDCIFPNTAGVLRSIAEKYEKQAVIHDQSVEIGY
ncbi:hypothetical protein BMR04_13555 [Methylococcaceae bacterium HT3]|nr:hypothetical protein BMR04_13555 [Methylococcaceae bacterium HT3]